MHQTDTDKQSQMNRITCTHPTGLVVAWILQRLLDIQRQTGQPPDQVEEF